MGFRVGFRVQGLGGEWTSRNNLEDGKVQNSLHSMALGLGFRVLDFGFWV